jgi:hypothetical protein
MIEKPMYKNVYLISYMLLHGKIHIIEKILKIDKNNYKKLPPSILVTLAETFHFQTILDFFSILPNEAIKYLSKPYNNDWYLLYFFKNAPLPLIHNLLKYKKLIPFNTVINDWYILRAYLSEYYESKKVDIPLLNELLILSKDLIEKNKYEISIINLSCINGYDEKVLNAICDLYPNSIADYDKLLLTPLMLALKKLNIKLALYILNKMKIKKYKINYNYFNMSCALIMAIKLGENKILKQLLNFPDININVHDVYKWLPGHLIFLKDVNIDMDIKKEILMRTDNLNVQNLNGNTILHYICSTNSLKDYEDILKTKELNLFVKNILDMTPIHYCDNIKLLYKIVKFKSVTMDDINSVLQNTYEYKDNNDINFIDSVKVDYSLFTATDYDSMIYILYFISKYRINYLGNDKKYKILKKYNNKDIKNTFDTYLSAYKGNNYLQNFNIMWYNRDNWCYSEGITLLLKDRPGITFIQVTIIGLEFDHSNGLIIDGDNKRIIHFEPMGIINSYSLDGFDDKFKKIFKKILPKYTYYAPKDYMNINSFQSLSDEINKNFIKIGDIGGFCLAWTLWFLELYIKNKNTELNKLVTIAIKKIINTKYLFSEYIRSYANKLTIFRTNILIKNEYSKKRIFNEHRSDKEISEIYKLLNELFRLTA